MKKNEKLISLGLIVMLLLSIMLTGCGSSKSASTSSTGSSESKSKSGETVKIGYLQDLTGDYSAAGILKYHGAQVAVQQINENGGIDGKQVELDVYDTASDAAKDTEGAKKLILNDKCDVLMGAYSSPAHEAVRTVAEKNNKIFFYNQVYEGGVASKNFYCTSLGEDLQLQTLMDYMTSSFGKKVFVLYADYNWGQISAEWVKKYTEELGGEIVGYEAKPFGTSEFSDVIAKIQETKPDVIVTEIVGNAMNGFFTQLRSAGIETPIGCTVNISNGEQISIPAPTMKDVYVTTNYAEEIDTPENETFKEYWKKMFPDEAYIGADAYAEYCGIYLYKLAVEDAGTTETEAVMKSLDKKIPFEGPVGPVYIDPITHHGVLKQYLLKCDEKHNISVVKEWEPIVPTWLSETMGVDLTKESPNKAFTPADEK